MFAPSMICPICGKEAFAEWVDIGFGSYSQQVGPYHCAWCNWVEMCAYQEECVREKCMSWEICSKNPSPTKEKANENR